MTPNTSGPAPRVDEATITGMIQAYRATKEQARNIPDTAEVDQTKSVANYHAVLSASRADALLKQAEYISQYGLYSRSSVRSQVAYEMECAVYNTVFGQRTEADLDNLITSALALRSLGVRQ